MRTSGTVLCHRTLGRVLVVNYCSAEYWAVVSGKARYYITLGGVLVGTVLYYRTLGRVPVVRHGTTDHWVVF